MKKISETISVVSGLFSDAELGRIIDGCEGEAVAQFTGEDWRAYPGKWPQWCWYLDKDGELASWLYGRLAVMMAGVDVTILHYIQYCRFKEGGFLAWHQDNEGEDSYSAVLHLSDPSEYDGGDLEIRQDGRIITGPKEKGLVVRFPLSQFHQVTPVTRGLRRVLLFWSGTRHWDKQNEIPITRKGI